MGMMKMSTIANEPDSMTHGVLKYHALGQGVWTTTTIIGARLTTLTLLLIGSIASRRLKNATDVSGTFQNMLEYAMEMLDKMAEGILGGNARRFVSYIGTISLFILFCNSSGLFGLRAPTGDFGVMFLLGMFTFFIVNYQGIKNRGAGHSTSLFQPIPILFPISVIGRIVNPISISLCLFANLLSGITIMGPWYGMMPWLAKTGIPVVLHVYCDLFSGCIQTYVFCMLTIVHINDKMEWRSYGMLCKRSVAGSVFLVGA